MRSRSRIALAATALLALAGAATNLPTTPIHAAFSGSSSNPSTGLASAPDWVAPSASATVIAKDPLGYIPGFVRPNGTYRAYAQESDTGNPASGTATVTGDLTALTVGQSAAALAAGAFSVGGVSYNRRGAALSVAAGTTAGAKAYSLTLTDSASPANARTQTGFTVTVDNVVPSATDVQTANKAGGIAGKAEIDDTMTLTFSEEIEPYSVLANWTGASTNVVVRLNNNIAGDRVQVWNAANTAQLPLGQVVLGDTGFTTANRTFGATGTASTMTKSGAVITLVLGTASGATGTETGTSTLAWTPSATATDPAGNATSTTARNETGAADLEF